MAFSELGLTEDEFYRLTPRQTYLLELANKRKIDRQWEQTREIAVMVHNMAGRFSKRNITTHQFMELPFDRKAEYPEWTKEEANELILKWSN